MFQELHFSDVAGQLKRRGLVANATCSGTTHALLWLFLHHCDSQAALAAAFPAVGVQNCAERVSYCGRIPLGWHMR